MRAKGKRSLSKGGGKREMKLRNGLVAFVDMLGFSNRVESIRRRSDEEDLSALERDVEFVQSAFQHRPQEQYIRESQRLSGKKVLAFSDCVVISFPFTSSLTKSAGIFDALGSELHTLALAQAQCVSKSIFLRGGIDLGLWYRNADTLISPAMVRAYRLEHEASVPVIAVTDKLADFLYNHEERGFYSKDADPLRKLLTRNPSIPGNSNFYYLDYLPLWLDALDTVIAPQDAERYESSDVGTRDKMRTLAWESACRSTAKLHRDHVRSAYRSSPDEVVRAKYRWLIDYHNSRVSAFFHSEAAQFLISDL